MTLEFSTKWNGCQSFESKQRTQEKEWFWGREDTDFFFLGFFLIDVLHTLWGNHYSILVISILLMTSM